MSSAKNSLGVQDNAGLEAISVVFMNGVVVFGDKALLIRWLKDKQTWAFFGIVSAVFLILTGFILPDETLPPENWQVIAVTLGFVFTFFSILSLIILTAFYISRFAPNPILPVTLVVFVVHLLTQLLAVAINYYVWGIEETASTFLIWRLLGLYLVVVIYEVIFTAYILPNSLLYHCGTVFKPEVPAPVGTSAVPEAISEEAPAMITLAGKQFALASIKMIGAEDNYIRVQTTSETVLVRARMNDVIASLPETAGIQAHRSFWVSFWHIEAQEPLKDGKLLLTLSDGETLTVPRARKTIVSQALGLFQKAQPRPL